jgi:DNA topoisomerase I
MDHQKNLVIVESPAKAKTIEKYLGPGFKVLASFGHVRDLQSKTGAVNPDDNFAMNYEVVERNAKHVTEIQNALKKSDALFLATDPDREGEAIAWSVYELMKEKKLLKDKPVQRIVFHEITKTAIKEALENPRDLSQPLIEAQQARRALDHLVGFHLSPLLWKKVQYGLSAGRVQSPALRMIVEREQEIQKFEKREYWTIEAKLTEKKQAFTARLLQYQHNKIEQFTITQEADARRIEQDLLQEAKGHLSVIEVTKKQRKRNPTAPFITSTLQQEAARKLGFTAYRTMRIAQQLYEGIDTGEGATGLISYMRTDSVSLAKEAVEEIRQFIQQHYDNSLLPKQIPTYRTKAKNAQEAHEAIRPTSAFRTPDSIKHALSAEQYKLYNLIWKRTIACQMIPAVIDTVGVDLSSAPGNVFRANGSVISKPGFMTVYQEGIDDKTTDDDEKLLPALEKGDKVKLDEILGSQHFTEPPPRYTEASLIKALEEHGIGRPSTYAAIISTLQKREYVTLDKKRFIPSDVGQVVNRFLTEYFEKYVDYDFTANLEDQLDAVSRGEKPWLTLLKDFWSPFSDQIETINDTVQRKDVTQEAIDEKCPTCGKGLSIRLGKRGRFIGCTAYPECKYTRNLDGEDPDEPEVVPDRTCPKCESGLVIKVGRYGKFIGCSNYPTCRHIEPLEKPSDTEVQCPKCNQGNLLKRKSRYGKIFFSCQRYPDCDYAVWYQPLAEKCPECAWPILTIKVTKRRGREKACPQKECKFTEPAPEDETEE